MDQVASALTLSLKVAGLATLQGGGPSTAARVAAARAHDDTPSSSSLSGSVGGIAVSTTPASSM